MAGDNAFLLDLKSVGENLRVKVTGGVQHIDSVMVPLEPGVCTLIRDMDSICIGTEKVVSFSSLSKNERQFDDWI